MARLLGSKDSVISLPAGQDIVIGRGTNNIPATDKRCSRQSLQVRFNSETAQVQVTQVGVNPGIVHHGTPQEAYMVVNQTYNLDNGQKFTVLMHDYEFTVSIPGSASIAPKPTVIPEPVEVVAKKDPLFDWMTEETPTKPEVSKSANLAPSVPSPSPADSKPVCMYGANCRRNNPIHFQEYSHPHLEGKSESAPSVPSTANSTSKPICSYGVNCRRNNPVHFQQYAHPHLDGKPESPIPVPVAPSSTSSAAPISATSEKSEAAPKDISPEAALAKFEENLNVNLHPSMAVSKPPSASDPSPSAATISAGKRPMPAVDLMDDEENYLPKAKKPKVSASTSAVVNKDSLMDWMGETKDTSEAGKTGTAAIKMEISVAPTAAPTAATPPSSQAAPAPQASTTSHISSVTPSHSQITRKEEDLKKRPVSSTNGIHSMDIDSSKPTPLQSCKLDTLEELDVIVTKYGFNPSEPLALLVPGIGRGYAVQEAVDALLETFEHFAKKAKPGTSLKLYFWPETPVWAAAMRRRLSALPKGSSDGTGEVSLAQMIEMLPPASELDSVLAGCSQDRLIIANESNWRFKGIGTPTSFNVQLNKLYSTQINATSLPSLLNDTKALYSVGVECAAYPVVISENSGVKKQDMAPKATHIIQLVPPSVPADASPNIALLKSCYTSLLGCLVHLTSMGSS